MKEEGVSVECGRRGRGGGRRVCRGAKGEQVKWSLFSTVLYTSHQVMDAMSKKR